MKVWEMTQQEFIDKWIEANPFNIVNIPFYKHMYNVTIRYALIHGHIVPKHVQKEYNLRNGLYHNPIQCA